MNNKGLKVVVVTAGLIILSFVFFEFRNSDTVKTDLAYLEAETITLHSQVSAPINNLNVSEGEDVSLGQEILILNDLTWRKEAAEIDSAKLILIADSKLDENKKSILENHLSDMRIAAREQEEAVLASEYELMQAERAYDLGNVSAREVTGSQIKLAENQFNSMTANQAVFSLIEKINELQGNEIRRGQQFKNLLTRKKLLNESREHYLIGAPVNGRIAQIFAHPGESINTGDKLLQIIPSGKTYVTAYIQEMDIPRIRKGSKAMVTFDSAPNEEWMGEVILISPVGGASMLHATPNYTSGHISRIAQRIPVRIALSSNVTNERFIIGMSATVAIEHIK
jgi:membrane fusion protein (multidrug efflux system)